MRIAIAGAGFAGLAAAWHCLQKNCEVVLFDPKGIGGGASGASTGLCHPFPGKKAERSFRSQEAMREAEMLFRVAEAQEAFSIASYTGIFRPAATDLQKHDFLENRDVDVSWQEIEINGVFLEGLWIEKGITVFSSRYLQALWKACQAKGAILKKEPFLLSQSFDRTIFALGADILELPFGASLGLRKSIGQSLLCKCQNPLPFSLASNKYIAVTADPSFCHIGSTYEHTEAPSPSAALGLLDLVSSFYPPAKEFTLQDVRFGVRVGPKIGHAPVIEQIDAKTWVFTGLGSRGLLYHSLFAKELADSICK